MAPSMQQQFLDSTRLLFVWDFVQRAQGSDDAIYDTVHQHLDCS